MPSTTDSIELSARNIVRNLNLLEIQAAADDNKLSGTELDAFNKRVTRDADGRFGSGGGGASKAKVKEAANTAIDKVSDLRREAGQSIAKVDRDRAIAKAEVAKAVDAIYSSPQKAKAALDSIGPNISGAIDAIGKELNGKSKQANDKVHEMMDGIGSGIRSNSQNVADTIGKDLIAAKLYLDGAKNNVGAGIGNAKKGASDFGKGIKEGFTESESAGASSQGKAGRQVGRAALDAKNSVKDAGASIGRAATGLAAFLSPEHLAEVGKNISKAASDGAKQTPAKIKSMLNDLAKKAKESIDKGTMAIKDFGTGVGQGFVEGANNKFLKDEGKILKVGKPENDSAAKAAGRKIGQFAGDRPMLAGYAAGAIAFGMAAPLAIPTTVGVAIGEDLSHPQSQIKKHIGLAYAAASVKLASMLENKIAIKPLASKQKQEAKDKLDRSTANLAVATIAKDDKKIEQHKNEIADLASKIQTQIADARKNAEAGAKDLQSKLEPLLKQAQQEIEKSPAARATAIGVGLGGMLVGPGALVLGIPEIGAAKGVDNLANNAKQEKTKVQAAVLPQFMMASVIGASAKKMANSI